MIIYVFGEFIFTSISLRRTTFVITLSNQSIWPANNDLTPCRYSLPVILSLCNVNSFSLEYLYIFPPRWTYNYTFLTLFSFPSCAKHQRIILSGINSLQHDFYNEEYWTYFNNIKMEDLLFVCFLCEQLLILFSFELYLVTFCPPWYNNNNNKTVT